jgi:hypothetical protein
MRNIHLLLANTDRQMSNKIEAAVLDVCYDQATVACTRACRTDELGKFGSYPGADLIVVAPDNLLGESGRRTAAAKIDEVAMALARVRQRSSVPIIAVNCSPEDEAVLREAGVDSVLGVPYNIEVLKAEVRERLKIEELVEAPAAPRRWSFAALFTL